MLEDLTGGMASLTVMSDGSALVVFDVEDEDEDFVAEGETPEDALDEAFAIVQEFFDTDEDF